MNQRKVTDTPVQFGAGVARPALDLCCVDFLYFFKKSCAEIFLKMTLLISWDAVPGAGCVFITFRARPFTAMEFQHSSLMSSVK